MVVIGCRGAKKEGDLVIFGANPESCIDCELETTLEDVGREYHRGCGGSDGVTRTAVIDVRHPSVKRVIEDPKAVIPCGQANAIRAVCLNKG